MNIANLKKLNLSMILAIIFILISHNIINDCKDISTSVIYIYNSFDYENLIDVYSIAIYAIPLALSTFIITLSCNSFYENYIFLVTRLGGQKIFNEKLFIKAISETFWLTLSIYLFTILFIYFQGNTSIGELSLIVFSFVINYSLVLFLVICTLTFRIYYSYSISITFTYLIEISFLVIGLFFEYFQLNRLFHYNPLMNSILFFHNKPGVNTMCISFKSIVINLAFIVIVSILYNILSRKKEEN